MSILGRGNSARRAGGWGAAGEPGILGAPGGRGRGGSRARGWRKEGGSRGPVGAEIQGLGRCGRGGTGARVAAFPQLPPCQGHPGPLSTPLWEAASSSALPLPSQWGWPEVEARAGPSTSHLPRPPLSCSMSALSLTLSLLPRTAEFEFLQRRSRYMSGHLSSANTAGLFKIGRQPPAWQRFWLPPPHRHLRMGVGDSQSLRSCRDEEIHLLPKI